MTSFPKEVEGSSRRLPPIQFGEVIFEQEESGPSQRSQNQEIQPISPQLLFSLMKKPPRKPPQLSRIVSPPPSPPDNLTQKVTRFYVAVPSQWCDSRVGSRATYLSRDPLLREVFPRRLLYRRFRRIRLSNEDQVAPLEVQMLGYPTDYWLSFPLKPPNSPQCSRPILLEGQPQNPDQEMAHAWAIGPDRCSLDTLERVVEQGPEPVDAMKFPWITTKDPTKIVTLRNMLLWGVEKVSGFVQCPKCKSITGLSYLIPGRFAVVLIFLGDKAKELWADSEKVLKQSDFRLCECTEGLRPVISDDLRNINWLFLFLGCFMGYCTKAQLKFFCSQRGLETSGTKHDLLYRVCDNICKQLKPGISFPPDRLLQTVQGR